MENIYNPTDLTLREVVYNGFTVVGGAAGFIETDVSAVIPGNARLSWWNCYSAAVQKVGVRNTGSAIDTKHDANASVHNATGIARVIAGKVDLYRSAADNTYYCLGYIR